MSLLEEAARVEAAADLLRGQPAEQARAVIEACASPDVDRAPPRAVWNLLWIAGELSVHVDLYLAADLLGAVERLFVRSLQHANAEQADAAEMAFDFFFNRPPGEQPLLSARFDDALATLGRVLALPAASCRRAALHGLGHVRQQLEGPARDRVDALFDAFVLETDSTALAQYAVRARAGELL